MGRGQALAVGAAAASPFAGLIGRKPIQHDPLQGAQGKDFGSMTDLSKASRPGDVLVTSKDKGSLFKNFILPAGDSQFYHAQPVTGRAKGRGYTLSAGDLAEEAIGETMKPKDALNFDHEITKYMQDPETSYSDAVLLRPKQPLTPAQTAALQKDYGKRVVRSYDNSKALGTFLNEIFVPKSEMLSSLRPETVCEGNVCSTLPAMSHYTATGQKVLPNKAPQDIFPTDFLRSDAYELVGSHITPETRALEGTTLRRAAPWLLRGGLGAGLAAGTYAATEDPASAAGLAGAAGGYHAAHKLAPELPTLWDAGNAVMGPGLKNPETRQVLKTLGSRAVPGMLAGGALAYGGAKGLEHLLRRDSSET